jgi:hypothetical protein
MAPSLLERVKEGLNEFSTLTILFEYFSLFCIDNLG